MEVQIGGPVDTDIPPSTHRQGKDPPERPGWSLWPAPPLTQGEAAAGPGPHQPLIPPVTLHVSVTLTLLATHSTVKSRNGHTWVFKILLHV